MDEAPPIAADEGTSVTVIPLPDEVDFLLNVRLALGRFRAVEDLRLKQRDLSIEAN